MATEGDKFLESDNAVYFNFAWENIPGSPHSGEVHIFLFSISNCWVHNLQAASDKSQLYIVVQNNPHKLPLQMHVQLHRSTISNWDWEVTIFYSFFILEKKLVLTGEISTERDEQEAHQQDKKPDSPKIGRLCLNINHKEK